MNVLVVTGPGVAHTALRHTLASLRALLAPHYSVQTVHPDALTSPAWTSTCALLVLTGGRDVPYLSSLAAANAHILKYVSSGGSFLGFCAGAYYASGRVEWEVGRPSYEVVGERPLKLFPGLAKGCVYPDFQYDSESGARAVSVISTDDVVHHGLYYNGGGEFVDVGSYPNCQTIAQYNDGVAVGKSAAVLCNINAGRAALWGVHIEYSLLLDPLSSILPAGGNIEQWELERRELLKDTLQRLRLRLPARTVNNYYTPLPQYLIASPSLSSLVSETLVTLSGKMFHDSSEAWILSDIHDTFHFHKVSPGLGSKLAEPARSVNTVIEPKLDGPKHVIVCEGVFPEQNETPLFNIDLYYSTLHGARQELSLPQSTPTSWGMGELLFYSEAVTSTQTMFDQNPGLMNNIPTPVLSIATHQMSGRGRGGNVWLSPPGPLMFSLLLRTSSSSSGRLPYVPTSRLVYVQYLVGIAVVQACRKQLGEDGYKVRLKWPNDIYAVLGGQRLKLGGILVGTTFHHQTISLLIGCGLNVFNDVPTTSLMACSSQNASLKIEKLAASIMAHFEKLWLVFVAERGSFEPFLDLYLNYWLHSDEIVTVTTTSPHTKVSIAGITPEHGLLRTIPVDQIWMANPRYIDLQPDGNSFDMMAGLIKLKGS